MRRKKDLYCTTVLRTVCAATKAEDPKTEPGDRVKKFLASLREAKTAKEGIQVCNKKCSL